MSSDPHLVVCNCQDGPIGCPGCVCAVVNRREWERARHIVDLANMYVNSKNKFGQRQMAFNSLAKALEEDYWERHGEEVKT